MPRPISHVYRADIDGLRAVAILLVVLFHSGVDAIPGGFIGVDLFFVISGFLIGGIISREIRQGTFSFYHFYLRRIRRIAPALFFMMLVLLVIGYSLLSPLEYGQLAKYSFGVFLAIPNMVLLQGTNYFSSSADFNPLLMTWSLGIEEQFYVVLPVILLLAARLKQSFSVVVVVLSVMSLAACIWLTPVNTSQAFYLLPTRAWELGAGVLLALWKPQPLQGRSANLLTLMGLALIFYSALTLDKAASFPGYLAILPVLAGCMMIAARSTLSQWLLENALMRFIGKISYSWYLWHWPMLALTRILSDQPISAGLGLTISAAALVISWLSWRYVEQPFRQPMGNTRAIIPTYCLLSAVATAGMFGIWYSGGLTYRVDRIVLNSEDYKIAAQTNPCLLSYGGNLPSKNSRCQPETSRPGIALVGDSHAAALRDAVAAYADAQHKPLFQLTKATCPLLAAGVTNVVYGYPAHATQCRVFNDAVMKKVLSDEVDEVIISAYWASGMSSVPGAGFRDMNAPDKDNLTALHQGVAAVVTQLRQAGKKVTLIEDAPALDVDPLRWSNNRNIPLRRELSAWVNRWETLPGLTERTHGFSFPAQEVSAMLKGFRHEGIKVVSLREKLCNEEGCLITESGLPLYYDNNHLSPHGVEIALGKNW